MGPSSQGKKQASPFSVIDSFQTHAEEKRTIQQFRSELVIIIKELFPDTDALIDEIEDMGVPVIKGGPAVQLKLGMAMVGVSPGYIPPSTDFYNEFIEFIKELYPRRQGADFQRGVIITLEEKDSFVFLCYHLHHYMAFMNDLQGFSGTARKLFNVFDKKFEAQLTPRFLNKLDFEEACELRVAIRRDREALQFVKHILDDIIVPKNNAKLLYEGKAQA